MSEGEAPGQWVSELFPPAHSFFTEDILRLPSRDDSPVKSKIKRVAAFDPEAIQQMYEKVRLMKIVDNEMKQQAHERRRTELAEKTSGRKGRYSHAKSVDEVRQSLQDPDEDSKEPISLNDSGIWNTDEINTLRQVYKAAKGRIRELEVEVKELRRRNEILREERTKSETDLEETTVSLNDARKANQRLKIHCDNLKEQHEFTGAKLDAVTEMWKEISEERNSLQKQTQNLRVQKDEERLARERLQIKLAESDQEKEREKTLAQQSAETKFEKTIFDLQQEVTLLTDELRKERQSHDISKKALASLRNHFASLPMQNIVPPNAVSKDEVTNIDYLSL